MRKRKAFITGGGGMDGSRLADFLLEKDYDVYSLIRRSSTPNDDNIKHLIGERNFNVIVGDITDANFIRNTIDKIRPDYIFNLACQSHVGLSYSFPSATFQSVCLGLLNILDAVVAVDKNIKVYQASSSEQFGNNIDEDGYQRETTPFAPTSPYACGKVAAHNLSHCYINSYSLFVSCGILFNHEDIRRSLGFVTRKVTNFVANLYPNLVWQLGSDKPLIMDYEELPILSLGNLDSYRDWGAAKDYVRGMWMMLEQDRPDDFVLSTGKTHSIKDLLNVAFNYLGLEWEEFVEIDPKFIRPSEVNRLRGDYSKAKNVLGWEPTISFEELITGMVEQEIKMGVKQWDKS